MANFFNYKDKTFSVGDTISVAYKIKEGDKERRQIFRGILIKTRGQNQLNRMITVRKLSHAGIGVERIFPLSSPFILDIKLIKKSRFGKAKAYFIRNLSQAQLKHKLYRQK